MTPPERNGPHDPREWMDGAKCNLRRARERTPATYLEDLCFAAQQAAEEAIKALLVGRTIDFPDVHDLAEQTGIRQADGLEIPQVVRRAARLTQYATSARYPGFDEPVTNSGHEEPVELAEAVVDWAEGRL